MKLVLIVLILISPLCARQRVMNWCQRGGQTVTVGSQNSAQATSVMRSYTTCTVAVYLSGTNTLASIYSNNTGTAQANPFTSSATGLYFFYVNDGTYDLTFSGSNIGTPFTLGATPAIDPYYTSAGATGIVRTKEDKLHDEASAADFAGASVAAQLNAAIASFGGNKGTILIPYFMGAGDPTTVHGNQAPENITLIDHRGGLPVAVGLTYNGSTGGVMSGMRLYKSFTDPAISTEALEVGTFIFGSVTGAGGLGSQGGLSGQINIQGALTSVSSSTTLLGIEGAAFVQSTGQTIPRIYGATFHTDSFMGSTSGITEAVSVRAQAGVFSGSQPANAYGLMADLQTAGTVRNFSIWTKGSVLWSNDTNITALDMSGTPQNTITFSIGNLLLFRPLSDTVGTRFSNSANTADYLNFTSGTKAVFGPRTAVPGWGGIAQVNIADAGSPVLGLYDTTGTPDQRAWMIQQISFGGPRGLRFIPVNDVGASIGTGLSMQTNGTNTLESLVANTGVQVGAATGGLKTGGVNVAGTYWVNGVQGFTGSKTAGACTLTIAGGIITGVAGC